MVNPVSPWLARSLSRRLIMGLLIAMAVSSFALGGLALYFGRQSMQQEQELAASRLVVTFEASLYNAMLQRDLPGLQRIVDTLGQAVGIEQVRLLNPQGEVRFASRQGAMGNKAPELCGHTPCNQPSAQTTTWREQMAGPALEVSHRVANQARCAQCHGAPEHNPVNGVLVINFQPAAVGIWSQSELPLVGVGLLSLALFGALMAWTLKAEVARPLHDMANITDRIAKGDFSQRLHVAHQDEIGRVAHQLNAMADNLHAKVTHLKRQQAFLQDLLDAIPDPVLVIGPDWRIRLANKAYCDLIGRPLGDIHMQCCYRVGKGRSEPCPSTLVSCPVLENRTGNGLRTIMSLRHADGREVPVEIDSAALTLEGERLTVEVLRPLERTIRFSQEQRLSTIGLLANGVAHEIHNPLASIRLALQASLRGIRKGNMPAEELVGYLELVDAQIDRCVLTTQRLMQMSVPPDGSLSPISVQHALDDVLALMAEDANVRNVRIVSHIHPNSLAVMADAAELRQVFVNLVQNAMTALTGGGVVSIEAQPAEAGGVRIRVSDTGPGISPENLPHIFLPFFSRRVDGSKGMGLGLAVCKAIVERFGGTIEAGNQADGGAVLTLTLKQASTTDHALSTHTHT